MRAMYGTGFQQVGPAVSSVSSATQAEGTSLVHTVTLASAVSGTPGKYAFNLTAGTASTPSDYTATPTFSNSVTLSGGVLTVPIAVTTFTITVATTDDAVYEGSETYSVTVGNVTNTGTLTDNESAPTIASVSSASATEGSNIVHTVAVTGVAQASRTFALAFSGAAVGGTDYNATPTFSAGVTLSGGNITVPAGVTSFTVTVATINNASVDGSRAYTLTIGGASGTGSISDDDAPSPAFTATLTALTNATGMVTTLAYINPGSGSTVGSAIRDDIPKIVGIPTVGAPIAYLSARLPGSPAATASRILVNGVLKASGTTTVSYTPVLADAALMVTVEVDYAGPVSTVSMPMPILENEWMLPTPVTKDPAYSLTSNSQVGTNIYYIDPVDGVAPNLIQAYGWNGSAIIDSAGSTTGAGGVPYGTDPLNPTGPVIASKYSAAILLDVYGNAPGVRVGGAGYGPGGPEYSATTNRREASNWYLYKRGTVLDIDDDLTGYIAACATLGTTCQYTTSGLASLGGSSWATRQVFGSYGSTATERATFTKKTGGAMVLRNPSGVVSWSNIQYMDLIFNGKIRNAGVIPAKAFSMVDGSDGDRVWATGCLTFGCMNTPVQGGDRHFMFYRTAIIDAFGTASSGHTQGIFSSGLTGNARMQVLESFMAQNGFRFDPQPIREAWDSIPAFSAAASYADEALAMAPDGKIWVARGAKTPSAWTGTGWVVAGNNRKPVPEDVFARNNYWSGKFSATEAFVSRSVLFPAASGEQLMRDRGRVEANLIYSGYLGSAAGGGHDGGTTVTNQILDNVFFSYSDGTGSNPAWNMGLAMGAANASVRRNIVSRQLVTGGYSFTLESVAWEGSGYVYKNPVLSNKIEFNILDTGTAASVAIMDGYRGATGSAFPTTDAEMALTRANYGAGPGVLNNSVSNNWFITTNGAFSTYTQTTGAPATDTTNTIHTGNATYASRAAAAAALGGVDGTRTPATYLTSLGFTLEGTDTDGVKKWVDLWKTQRRGNWNSALTAPPVIDYVRAGFGMSALDT